MVVEKHLRVSVKHINAHSVISSFVATFKPLEWVCCYENKNLDPSNLENEINPHIHCYLKYDKVPTSQKISDFFKKQPILKSKNIAGYYHKIQSKTTKDNIIYTIKHQNFIDTNISKEILDKYIEESNSIDEDKKLSSKDKLYNRYIKKYGLILPSSKFDLFRFIDEVYVHEFDKTPLAHGHLICYSKFIVIKLFKEINDKWLEPSYKDLMLSLYNIRKNDQLEWEFNQQCDKESEERFKSPTFQKLKEMLEAL